LELVGDDERCVALAGLLPVRLLAERGGLTAGISAAMRRPGYDPGYDRGQVLLDLGHEFATRSPPRRTPSHPLAPNPTSHVSFLITMASHTTEPRPARFVVPR
jgi:hypothetical protein